MHREKLTTKILFGAEEELQKVTIRLPRYHIDYLKEQAEELDVTLTVCTEMVVTDGIRSWKKQDKEKEEEAREKRKQEGYLKRSFNRLGTHYNKHI